MAFREREKERDGLFVNNLKQKKNCKNKNKVSPRLIRSHLFVISYFFIFFLKTIDIDIEVDISIKIAIDYRHRYKYT